MIESQSYIIEEYNETKYLYHRLIDEISTQINALLEESQIKLATPIEKRVKTLNSVIEKCKRYKLKLSSISEINDIAGIRIVALFKRDIEQICNLINENFIVEKTEDVSNRLSENQFGYGSIHFEVTAKNEWFAVPTLKSLKGLKLEIQVRTASQHIWAASSHILQYKREDDVPPPVLRTINRAAALLEVVDLEFERVLSEREKFMSTINLVSQDEGLNADTLRYILDQLLPPQNKEDNEDYADLLDELRFLNIGTIGDLEEIIKNHMEAVINDEKVEINRCCQGDTLGTTPERAAKNVYYTHVGLTRCALGHEFGEKFRNYLTMKISDREY